MGRGRQKAKQTKVARQLKYFSPETDYERLQRELASNGHHVDPTAEGDLDEADVEKDELDEDLDEDEDYAQWSHDPRG